MIPAELATPDLLKIKVFWNKGSDVITFIKDATNIILSRGIFMIEVIITQILDGFDQKTNFEGWPSLKFNNLRLVRGMALKFYCSVAKGLTLKQLWGWQGGQSIWLPSCGLSKNVSSKERVKPWFFVIFNIIIGHIFPENSVEIPQVFQKIWRISLSILAIFIISLLQRK